MRRDLKRYVPSSLLQRFFGCSAENRSLLFSAAMPLEPSWPAMRRHMRGYLLPVASAGGGVCEFRRFASSRTAKSGKRAKSVKTPSASRTPRKTAGGPRQGKPSASGKGGEPVGSSLSHDGGGPEEEEVDVGPSVPSSDSSTSSGGGDMTSRDSTAPNVEEVKEYSRDSGPQLSVQEEKEDPLNLRAATLMQQPGKAFRVITVTYEAKRELNFALTFEDIASGIMLNCRLQDVRTEYMNWLQQFRASWVVLFVPTLAAANATLLENAIVYTKPEPALGVKNHGFSSSWQWEVPDHVLISYSKMREVLCKVKRDEQVDKEIVSNTVLNAVAEDWKNFIHSAASCSPASIVTASFNFRPSGGYVQLNKQLLHSQLTTTAMTLLRPTVHDVSQTGKNSVVSAAKGAVDDGRSSVNGDYGRKEPWSLIFVSAPPGGVGGNFGPNRVNLAVPPMQDLLSGEFVEPLALGGRNVVYIIGSGTAAEAFAKLPLVRKGKRRVSILLKDIESQLGPCRLSRPTLTTTLIQALDAFSRYTWMGLMKEEEEGVVRVPRPPRDFARLHRRSVMSEVLPAFLEPTLGHMLHDSSSGGAGVRVDGGGAAAEANSSPQQGKTNRRVDEHIRTIFGSVVRLKEEEALRDKLRASTCFFVDVISANVTAARRTDNPFSTKNGILEFHGQLWSSIDGGNSVGTGGKVGHPRIETFKAQMSPDGSVQKFVAADACIPIGLPIGLALEKGKDGSASTNASNGIIIAWDVKRALLFLRESKKLRQFLCSGGRIWCAQYAQYLLKGFNHRNLATMERTVLQYHTSQSTLHPIEKLKIIFESQLDIAVCTRQLISIVNRMDGLLACTEMELRGLQIAPQEDVTEFARNLKRSREELEKTVNNKIMVFTEGMDSEVRRRINLRSTQDISTLIYGGALCRHLGTRFLAQHAPRLPVTAILPHAVCHLTSTPVPAAYVSIESLLVPKGGCNNNPHAGGGGGSSRSTEAAAITPGAVKFALKTIDKYVKDNTLENLLHTTAVVVVTCKVRASSFLEVITIHCPSSDPNGELRHTIAIDDVLPVMSDPEMVTVSQLKEKIASYKPLRAIQPLKKCGKRSYDLRNLLILTHCSPERTAVLVETGVIGAIAEVVLGKENEERSLLERVCFCDINRAFPPPPQGGDSFENDFLGLVNVAEHSGTSSRGNWEAFLQNLDTSRGFEATLRSLLQHFGRLIGTARDPFRTAHPLPVALAGQNGHPPHGSHGQERASTRGMLWMVTPERLHPLLHRSLRGRSASSGADAIERINVLLANEEQVDLSFFKALQQLRFMEKQMQLFEEGALFRAVLPECKNRVHGEFCHVVTATGRLSSQSPNLQNIPKEDLRSLIVSRFGRTSGRMIEADYSQLEVVVLAALSRDTRMLQELHENVDFHCLRVSLMTKEPYEHVVDRVKRVKDPHYIQLRQQAKTFSFQRQYGAGISTIATTTGLSEAEVERLIAAEEQHYKDLGRYYRLVTDCVEAGADRLLRLRTLDAASWSPAKRRMILMTEPMHYFVVPTGSKFDFTKDKKSVPRLKNYPVQGLAGEIVQIICGKIIRRFYSRNNYNDKAFLVNTVHDCVWIDAHVSVADEVMRDVSDIMSSTSDIISSLWPDVKLDVPFKADIHIGTSLGELSK